MGRSMWRWGGRYGIRIHRAKSLTRRIWTHWGRLLRPWRRAGDGSWSALFHEPPKRNQFAKIFGHHALRGTEPAQYSPCFVIITVSHLACASSMTAKHFDLKEPAAIVFMSPLSHNDGHLLDHCDRATLDTAGPDALSANREAKCLWAYATLVHTIFV